MPSNQKKIRDVERMIKRFGSTPALLAKLEEAKHGKEDVQLKERQRKNSTKYHMVRFLERKKVTRLVRSVESKLKADEGNAKLVKNRERLLNDLAYIMYYPMEHKYIALFPSKEALEKNPEDSDDEPDSEKSKQLSKKAREIALQRWAEEKQRVTDGVAGAVDKVAYAMEVEYKGGAAAAANLPAKPSSAPQSTRTKSQSSTTPGASQKPKTAAPATSGSANGTATVATRTAAEAGGESSSDSSSDADSSDSDSESDSAEEEGPKTSAPKATGAASNKKHAPSAPAAAPAPVTAEESSDSDGGDDFFVEEASESELPKNSTAATQPKVYNDGNSFRYKNERQNVHEIRFAATKRKYERHKRVFNNQNKRSGAQERKKQRN